MSAELDPIQNLFALNYRLVGKELKLRSKKAEQEEVDFENRIWLVAHALRPTYITVGRDPLVSLQQWEYHPDMLALFESFALVIECTYTEAGAYLAEELLRLEEARKPLRDLVRNRFNLRSLVAILAVKRKSSIPDNLRKHASEADIKIIEEREVNYYLALMREAGVGIYYQFFARVAPAILQVGRLKVPAIRIKEGRRYKYIFSVNPHELLKRAFISHRELTSPEDALLGYQRMFKKAKLRDTAQYIKKSRGGFPSPIIVSLHEKAGEVFDPLSPSQKEIEDVTLGYLWLPRKPASIYVVDGQHRLYAYTLLERSEDHYINVIAYKGLRGREQASMFVDINLKQTKVPSRLLWELYPDILSPDDEEYYKAITSRAVERLAKDKLMGKVSHISSGMRGKITFHAMCTEIVRANLIAKAGSGLIAALVGHDWDKQGQRLYIILAAFFDAISLLSEQHPDATNRFFLHNSGMIPLLHELGKICKHISLHKPTVLRSSGSRLVKAFKDYLEPLFCYYGVKTSDELDYLRKTRVGSSGFIRTEDEMDDEIRKMIPSFPLREKRTPPELQRECEAFVAAVQQVNRKALDCSTQWVFREFDKDQVLKQISRPVRDVSNLERLVGLLYQEIVEGSGAQSPQNRICTVLGIQNLNEIPILRRLSYLRHKFAHRDTQIDANKRAEALQFLRDLANSPSLGHFDNLDPDKCLTVHRNLLLMLRQELLDVLAARLG